MAWKQKDLDAVNAAISSGAKLVRHKDDLVEYSSLDELIRTRNLIKAELDAASGVAPKTRIIRVYTGSGWGS